MAAFPEDVIPSVPFNTTDQFLTLRSSKYDSGRVVVTQGRSYPLYSAHLTYPPGAWSTFTTLYQFIFTLKGAYTTFTFFDFNGWDSSPIGIQWPKLYVGVCDGSTVAFDLPYKSGSSYLIYRNGALLTVTTDYAVTAGTGTDGRDLLTMVSAGTSGHIIEAGAIGRRAVTARLTTDVVSFSSMYNMLTQTGLDIEEVR